MAVTTGSESDSVMNKLLSWPAVLCWLTVLLEGYDLVVLGAVIPTLIDQKHVGFTAAGATFAATMSLVGVAIGATGSGPVADRYGRRWVLVGSIVVFSLFTAAVPLAGSVSVFAAFRLVAGVGLGACMPTALTMMAEHMPPARRAFASTVTMTGYHVGAVCAALLALRLVPNWEPLFYAGGAAGLVLLPVVWAKLPESAAYLAAKDAPTRVRPTVLLRPVYVRATLGVWVGSFMGLLLVYGLNTWLPKLMRDAGYNMSTSLTVLLMLNIGAVVGLLTAGALADRRGIKPTVLVWFGAAAVFLAVLSVKVSSTVLLDVLVLVTGIFVFSAQVLIYAYVTQAYPAEIRATALGFASGVGRLGAIFGPTITGWLIVVGSANPWGFYLFAAVAGIGLLAMAAVPRTSVDGLAAAARPDPRVRPA
ncbi:putative MFS family arabinose efflux permease [Nocardia tenerifensis]|uniref:Putative MFS family arabinose efflux permease n=1 Tax=Nocardia tenerifensis TaxID=228006 RepID=A0A318KAG6_9NOCA|nr:aromatic acid/H+ symport family MFS transporter [Nocardia tenerifensis]PXX71106.1 putative MFS family arabinose efflux permease [Nocardia tenerifensis]